MCGTFTHSLTLIIKVEIIGSVALSEVFKVYITFQGSNYITQLESIW